jgi:uncharacterized delta-60 repeat protein
VGYAVHHNAAGGNSSDAGYGITIDAGGKILVTGYSDYQGPAADMAIWRYNSDGSLDTTFGTTGYVTYHGSFGGDGDYGFAITLDGNGKILVTGSSSTQEDIGMAIWRYNSDGTLDDTFNSVGYVVHAGVVEGGSESDASTNFYDEGVGRSIAFDQNGKILVAGSVDRFATYNKDMTIWRYNSDGSLDTTFNAAGYVVHHNAAGGDGYDRGKGMKLDASGNILVTGYSQDASYYNDMAIWRYIKE